MQIKKHVCKNEKLKKLFLRTLHNYYKFNASDQFKFETFLDFKDKFETSSRHKMTGILALAEAENSGKKGWRWFGGEKGNFTGILSQKFII